MALAVEALDHLVINVKDVETAAAWYERVLGMKRVVTEPRPGARSPRCISAARRSTCGPKRRRRSNGSPAARSRPAATISAS